MRKTFYYIKVRLPWGTVTHYQVSNELQLALEQQETQMGEFQSSIVGALINVPIIENTFQHRYSSVITTAKVISVFKKKQKTDWRTRGQIISKDNLNYSDKKQLKFLQHDYDKLSKHLIKSSWKHWKKIDKKISQKER